MDLVAVAEEVEVVVWEVAVGEEIKGVTQMTPKQNSTENCLLEV